MRTPSSLPLMSALVALFLLVSACLHGLTAAELFAREPLTVATRGGGKVTFNVELALTEAQREQGLMFRRMMGENEGMLFDFQRQQPVYMWMKNTVLPLDMLFMDKAGRITKIKRDAVPFSEEILSSGGPVRYVLELNAGAAQKFGIAEGDLVQSSQLGNEE